VLAITVLAACQNSAPPEPEESEVSLVPSEAPSEEPSPDPVESEEESSEAPEESEEPEEVSQEPAPEQRLNTDLLGDIGLTFDQIRARRGEVIETEGIGGGLSYFFERGYGYHVWLDWEHDWPEEGYPLPFGASHAIVYFPANRLFLELTAPTSTSDIARIYRVGYVMSEFCDYYDNYISTFLHGDIHIDVKTATAGVVASDSLIVFAGRAIDDNAL